MRRWLLLSVLTGFLAVLSVVDPAAAVNAAYLSGFQAANGPVAGYVISTYNDIFWVCLAVYVLVQGLILYCVVAFRRSAKRPIEAAKQFSHNTTMELLWTAIPIIICIFIGYKAYAGLIFMRTVPQDAMAVDVIAYQFGWNFEYPEQGAIAPNPTKPYAPLSQNGTDRYVKTMVVPVDKDIVLNITSKDVIHAVFVPALGIKTDAIPGRINYAWFRATKTGTFLGQCAELCGASHGEMFFKVQVLPLKEWQQWIDKQRAADGKAPLFRTAEVKVDRKAVQVSAVQE